MEEGRGKRDDGRVLRCKMVEGRRKSFMMEEYFDVRW